MPLPIDTKAKTWTYGCEHELADWDTRKGWEGYGRDPEPNIVNSNGIAADPTLKSYSFGAEINTLPSDTPEEQAEHLSNFLRRHRNATANWRCGMHVHIRIPGLKDCLPALKKLAVYISENTAVYDLVDPLPRENREQHPTDVEYKAARRRYQWMRMSHFTAIPNNRVLQQLAAASLQEFFDLEAPLSKAGKRLWHAQPRAAINLRQLKQTDTIEFRHFPQTLNPAEVITAVEWCRDYLLCAFTNHDAIGLFKEKYTTAKFPSLDTIFCGWQEERWLLTTMSKGLSRPEIEANIAAILEADNDDR